MKTRLRLPRKLAWLAAGFTIAALGFMTRSVWGAPQMNQAVKHEGDTYNLLVFSNPVPGTEDEYNKWYDTQHAPDVTSVPGFVSAQRYVVSDKQLRISDPLPKYLIVYKIVTNDLTSVYDEVNRRLKTGETKMSPTFDKSTSVSFSYKLTMPMTYHKGDSAKTKDSKLPTYVQVVFSNPTPGMEEEYNRWYSERHALEVVGAPGFVDVQRFALSGPQLNDKPVTYKYLALYEVKTDNIAARIADFQRIAPGMATSPAMGKNAGYTYLAIGPRVDGDKVRAERAAKNLSSSK
jgi:hypothetical protein